MSNLCTALSTCMTSFTDNAKTLAHLDKSASTWSHSGLLRSGPTVICLSISSTLACFHGSVALVNKLSSFPHASTSISAAPVSVSSSSMGSSSTTLWIGVFVLFSDVLVHGDKNDGTV